MKRFNFFALVMALAVAVFGVTSCSEELVDDGAFDGAVSYSGPLVGCWQAPDNSDGDVQTMTLGSNGTVVFESKNSEDTNDWWIEKGVFIVKENILELTYREYEDIEGKDADEYSEYYYIISSEGGVLELSFLFGEDMTLETALTLTADDGSLETYTKK